MKPLVKVLGAGLVAAGIGIVVGQQLAPKPKPIPAEPFGKLQYGNELFAKGKLLPPKVDEMTRYQLETEGQRPFAVVVACSDSRVPPELIFNQGLGNLFVVRTAGKHRQRGEPRLHRVRGGTPQGISDCCAGIYALRDYPGGGFGQVFGRAYAPRRGAY
jgi:hypothetical protein